MSFLELASLEKVYPDGTRAVHPSDLSVEEGEFIVLLGPSGCGKTTTLRMVAGLELPTGGAIRLAGEDVTMRRPSRRDVGFVFQFYALYPHLTVRENIAFPLAAVGTPRRERETAVSAVADRLGIAPLLERHPRQLSGGDQQRVSLARAMVRKPRIWLMDEPLGTLDADQRLAMREFIREQQLASRVTTLYVTHDQEEAMSLADRVVVMEAGRIRQAAPPAQVYDDPATRFVAEFVGSPGMNFLAGEIDAVGGFRLSGATTVLPLARPARPGPAVLGVRPEFVRPSDGGLPATVLMEEYLGAARIAHLDCGGARVAMRLPADRRAPMGERMTIGFDPTHARLFDPASGDRL
jgi:multiple sugar transport system ATP-binding protein